MMVSRVATEGWLDVFWIYSSDLYAALHFGICETELFIFDVIYTA